MTELESEIIATVLTQEEYNRVKFLEVKDFTTKVNQLIWGQIQKVEGDAIELFAKLGPKERDQWTQRVVNGCLGVWSTKVPQMGLKLVELRFERLLSILVNDLIDNSTSQVERSLLSEIGDAIGKKHILKLMDAVKDYLGDHITPYTANRIEKFYKYRDIRFDKIREVTNN